MDFFIQGLFIGFAIAAPVGPTGILCIQYALHHGFWVGLNAGLGAALADGLYGCVAGFGLTAISSFLIQQQFWIRLLGGFFMLYLGFRLILKPPASLDIYDSQKRSFLSSNAFGTTFLLTLMNPVAMMAFIGVFASLGLGQQQNNYCDAMFLVFGIMLGSALWWLILSSIVTFSFHNRISIRLMKSIHWFSGVIVLLFAWLTLHGLFL